MSNAWSPGSEGLALLLVLDRLQDDLEGAIDQIAGDGQRRGDAHRAVSGRDRQQTALPAAGDDPLGGLGCGFLPYNRRAGGKIASGNRLKKREDPT